MLSYLEKYNLDRNATVQKFVEAGDGASENLPAQFEKQMEHTEDYVQKWVAQVTE